MKSRRPSEARLYTLLTLMVFFWAANFVVAKFALRELPPLMLAGTRTLFAAVIILPLYWIRPDNPERHEPWTRADIPALLGAGLLGVVLNQLFFVIGLSMTSVAHASIIIGMGPIFVLLAAAAIGQERITGRKVAGIGIAAAGVALLQIGRASVRGPSALGDFFVLLGGLTFAIYTVLGKRLTTRHGSMTMNTFAYVAGGICLLPLTLHEGSRVALHSITLVAWLSVAYMAVFSSVVSYLIFTHALKYLPASRVSTFSYLQPLIATVLAAIFLREVPGPGFLGGGALVLGGVWLTERA